ncbi:MAG: DUF2604 domain-containing protein [Rhabdochlamydiaceae bacterium]
MSNLRKNETAKEKRGEADKESFFPISIVFEYRETFGSTFRPSDTLLEICQQALHTVWKETTQLSEWKLTDRYGKELSVHSKLSEAGIPRQETLYMSKKHGDLGRERLLVRGEDRVEEPL